MSNDELLREWSDHYHNALKYGSQDPIEIADVLTFGTSVNSLKEGLEVSDAR